MRPKNLTFAPHVDADGVCTAQTPAGAGNLTIDGALASGGVAYMWDANYASHPVDKTLLPCHISITSDGDDSGVEFTVTGTDRRGSTISETITGPDTTTVKSTKNFASVTQVAISAAGTGNITVGIADEFESAIIPVAHTGGSLSYSVELSSGASLAHQFQYTMTDIFADDFDEGEATWHDTLGAKTSTVSGGTTVPVRAVRLKVSDFVSGIIAFHVVQERGNN